MRTEYIMLALAIAVTAFAAGTVIMTENRNEQPMECISITGPVGGTICLQEGE